MAYYPTAYPSYYYPYAPGAALATGLIWAPPSVPPGGNHYAAHYGGDANINVNRNTNINTGDINRATPRPGLPAAPNRPPGSRTSSAARSAPRSARVVPHARAMVRRQARRWRGRRFPPARFNRLLHEAAVFWQAHPRTRVLSTAMAPGVRRRWTVPEARQAAARRPRRRARPPARVLQRGRAPKCREAVLAAVAAQAAPAAVGAPAHAAAAEVGDELRR